MLKPSKPSLCVKGSGQCEGRELAVGGKPGSLTSMGLVNI